MPLRLCLQDSRCRSVARELKTYDVRVEEVACQPEYANKVARYQVLRGIKTITAMTIVADVPFVILIALAEGLLGAASGHRVYYKRVDKRKVHK